MQYVYSTAYAEPGYVRLGNIITSTGTFKYSAGASNANHPYILVTDKGEVPTTRKMYTGYLDANGNATVSVPEIILNDMPVVVGYL